MPVSLEENVSWLEENNNNNKFSNENEWSITRAHSLLSIMYLWTSVSGQNLNGVTNQMTPLQQYFHRVLFILYVVLTFESVDEILWCCHSNETSSAVLSRDAIYFVCSSNFESVDAILWDDHSNGTSSSNVFGKIFAILAYLQISVKQCLWMNILHSFHKLAKYHHNGCSVDFIT